MKLLYPEEHFKCLNYDKGGNSALEILNVSKGRMIKRDLHDTEIVFIINGKLTLSYGKIVDAEVPAGKVMLFPPGSHLQATITEDAQIIVCRIKGIVQLCECVSLKQVFAYESKPGDNDFNMLDINEKLYKFIDFFTECAEDGLKCGYYFETKMKELFFLLRAYYPKEELRSFFTPLLSSDSNFTYLIYKNYRKVKNVRELAELSLYSESGFKKQFSRVFGTSASEWLRNQKAALIFHDLNCSSLSIKELANIYAFSSVSSFTNFSQQMFGKTPGQIRNQRTEQLEK